MASPDYSKAAAKGAALLDTKRPLWFLDVNTDELDMACIWNCVLGQIFGEYTVGTDVLAPNGAHHCPEALRAWGEEHGVEIDVDNYESSRRERTFELLTGHWRAEIGNRRRNHDRNGVFA